MGSHTGEFAWWNKGIKVKKKKKDPSCPVEKWECSDFTYTGDRAKRVSV